MNHHQKDRHANAHLQEVQKELLSEKNLRLEARLHLVIRRDGQMIEFLVRGGSVNRVGLMFQMTKVSHHLLRDREHEIDRQNHQRSLQEVRDMFQFHRSIHPDRDLRSKKEEKLGHLHQIIWRHVRFHQTRIIKVQGHLVQVDRESTLLLQEKEILVQANHVHYMIIDIPYLHQRSIVYLPAVSQVHHITDLKTAEMSVDRHPEVIQLRGNRGAQKVQNDK